MLFFFLVKAGRQIGGEGRQIGGEGEPTGRNSSAPLLSSQSLHEHCSIPSSISRLECVGREGGTLGSRIAIILVMPELLQQEASTST